MLVSEVCLLLGSFEMRECEAKPSCTDIVHRHSAVDDTYIYFERRELSKFIDTKNTTLKIARG